MLACALRSGSRRLTLIPAADPLPPAPGEVLLRVHQVGICGTDRELVHQGWGQPPAGSDHLILGHECVAEVAESADERWRPGQKVVARVRRPCPDAYCAPCRRGEPSFCTTGTYVERGIQRLHGFLQPYVIEDAACLDAIPDAAAPFAVLAEPLSIAEKAFAQAQAIQTRLPIAPDRTALVLGAGPIGLLGALRLRLMGYEVWIYSRSAIETPRRAARAMGVEYLPAESVSPGDLARCLPPPVLIYEAAGSPELTFAALACLAPNGVLVVTGGCAARTIPVPAGELLLQMVLRNQVVAGTVNARTQDYGAALAALAEGVRRYPEMLAMLITARIPIEGAVEAIPAPAAGIKTVVEFH
jgi:threonine dehydrogenase-like Zn-dependent dehydrogenase